MDLVPGPSSVKLAPLVANITQTLAPPAEEAVTGMEALNVHMDPRRIHKTHRATRPIRGLLRFTILGQDRRIAIRSRRHHWLRRFPPRHHPAVTTRPIVNVCRRSLLPHRLLPLP